MEVNHVQVNCINFMYLYQFYILLLDMDARFVISTFYSVGIYSQFKEFLKKIVPKGGLKFSMEYSVKLVNFVTKHLFTGLKPRNISISVHWNSHLHSFQVSFLNVWDFWIYFGFSPVNSQCRPDLPIKNIIGQVHSMNLLVTNPLIFYC